MVSKFKDKNSSSKTILTNKTEPVFAFFFLQKLINTCSMMGFEIDDFIDEVLFKKSLMQLGMPKALFKKNELLSQSNKRWLNQKLKHYSQQQVSHQRIFKNLRNLAKCTSAPRLYLRLYLFAFYKENDSVINSLINELIHDYNGRGTALLLLLEVLGITESQLMKFPAYELQRRSLLANVESYVANQATLTIDIVDFLEALSLPLKFRTSITQYDDIFDVESLIRFSYQLDSQSFLTPKDFDEEQFSTLFFYLDHEMRCKTKGINILLYGEPGLGKTELVKTLSASLGCDLFDISNNTIEQHGANLSSDMEAELLSTQLLCADLSDIILLVDECDDYFHQNPWSGRNIRKHHINQMLENSIVPTIWITNRPHNIEEAYIRRFDIAMEIRSPQAEDYEKKIRKMSRGLRLSSHYIQQICESTHLAIAHIEKAINVTQALGVTASSAEKKMTSLLNGYLVANGLDKLPEESMKSALLYDLSLTNCEGDQLATIKTGIKRLGVSRILLYGPPGTGKSAFAAHLARELSVPLISKKASDLLGAYVGQTEEKIAEAFNQAKQKSGVLLIDEVDSFLNSRSGHQYSWESTMVNEMLVQMENFDGVFIATTNFNQKLDHAVARRFDFKLKLNYLEPDQAELMFCQLVSSFKKNDKQLAKFNSAIRKLTNLTPGDFAVVKRKAKLLNATSLDDVYSMIELESKYKVPESNKIGFL